MIDRDKFLEMLDQLALNGTIAEPESYSGRAMYGKRCVSISGDSISEWGLAIALASAAPHYGVDVYDIPEPNTDSMGRSFIMYWPQIEWPEGRQDRQWDEDDENQPA